MLESGERLLNHRQAVCEEDPVRPGPEERLDVRVLRKPLGEGRKGDLLAGVLQHRVARLDAAVTSLRPHVMELP